MQYKEFTLENEEKVRRAAEGNETTRGVGWKDVDALAVAYDKLGGLITKGGRKVKGGVFWDFKKKVAKKKPEVIFLIPVSGKIVEVSEGEAMPLEVQAAELLERAEAEEKEVKRIEKKNKKEAKEEAKEGE